MENINENTKTKQIMSMVADVYFWAHTIDILFVAGWQIVALYSYLFFLFCWDNTVMLIKVLLFQFPNGKVTTSNFCVGDPMARNPGTNLPLITWQLHLWTGRLTYFVCHKLKEKKTVADEDNASDSICEHKLIVQLECVVLVNVLPISSNFRPHSQQKSKPYIYIYKIFVWLRALINR